MNYTPLPAVEINRLLEDARARNLQIFEILNQCAGCQVPIMNKTPVATLSYSTHEELIFFVLCVPCAEHPCLPGDRIIRFLESKVFN